MIVWLAQTKRNRFLNFEDRGDSWEVTLVRATLWQTKKAAEDALIDACYDYININQERCKAVKYRLEPFNPKGA